MAHVLMMVAYAASVVTLAALGVTLVRGGRFTPARATLLALIASALLWLGEAAWRLIVQPVDPTLAVAWAMPAAAITVASVRMLVLAASDASWKASPLTVLTFGVHPVATVMAAAMPELRALVVVAHADGTFSYGPAFWVHLIVSYLLLSGSALHMYGSRARIPVLAKHRPAAMIIAWAVPMSVNLMRTFLGDPGSADVTPIGLTLTAGVLYLVVVRGGFADLVPIARAKVFDQLVDAVFVIDAHGDLVDTNAKARSMVGLDARPTLALGVSLRDACPAIADVADLPGEHDVVCLGAARPHEHRGLASANRAPGPGVLLLPHLDGTRLPHRSPRKMWRFSTRHVLVAAFSTRRRISVVWRGSEPVYLLTRDPMQSLFQATPRSAKGRKLAISLPPRH